MDVWISLLLTKGSFQFLFPGVADERNVSKDNREKEREGRKGQMGGCTVVHLHPVVQDQSARPECTNSAKGAQSRREV